MRFDFIKDILSREYLHGERKFYSLRRGGCPVPIAIRIVEASSTRPSTMEPGF